MRHDAVDRYSAGSPLSAFDPRAKLIGVLLFVTGLAFLRDIVSLFVALMFSLCLLALSGIPGMHIARRFAAAAPLIAAACLSVFLAAGIGNAAAMALRISASALALILLVTTTGFFEMLKGLQRLRVPRIMVSMLMFTYRYIFVFGEELDRMRLARRSKAYKPGSSLLHGNTMRTIANTAGMVLVRAYERGLRVQDSLRMRGYAGEVRTLSDIRIRGRDAAFCIALAIVPGLGLCFQWGVLA